jgi:hypothetical protein
MRRCDLSRNIDKYALEPIKIYILAINLPSGE